MQKPVASQRLELLRLAPMNTWIALSADETRIIATGSTFVEADEAAKKTGEQEYFLTKTPDAWLPRAMPTRWLLFRSVAHSATAWKKRIL
jgi:hypothetical protein